MRKIPSNTKQNAESDVDFMQSFHTPTIAGPSGKGEIDSTGINSRQEPARRPSVDKKLELLSQQSPRKKTALKPTSESCPVRRRITYSEANLIDNLLRHLSVGSHDLLNLMIDIFEFHRYDKTLLNNYIANKSPDNLKLLETQIRNFPI